MWDSVTSHHPGVTALSSCSPDSDFNSLSSLALLWNGSPSPQISFLMIRTLSLTVHHESELLPSCLNSVRINRTHFVLPPGPLNIPAHSWLKTFSFRPCCGGWWESPASVVDCVSVPSIPIPLPGRALQDCTLVPLSAGWGGCLLPCMNLDNLGRSLKSHDVTPLLLFSSPDVGRGLCQLGTPVSS